MSARVWFQVRARMNVSAAFRFAYLRTCDPSVPGWVRAQSHGLYFPSRRSAELAVESLYPADRAGFRVEIEVVAAIVEPTSRRR